MNTRILSKCAQIFGVATVAMVAASQASAATRPAQQNPKVTGTYYGVYFPHSFTADAALGVDLDVGGAIMTFGLAYNTLGYYQAVSPRCVAFVRGRALNITAEFVSSPFGGLPGALTANDLDLLAHFESDFSQLSGVVTGVPGLWPTGAAVNFGTYRGEGVLNYVRKAPGVYFNENVAYTGLETFTLDYSAKFSNAGVIAQEATATVPGVYMEAKKVSDQLNTSYAPRVKIRR